MVDYLDLKAKSLLFCVWIGAFIRVVFRCCHRADLEKMEDTLADQVIQDETPTRSTTPAIPVESPKARDSAPK